MTTIQGKLVVLLIVFLPSLNTGSSAFATEATSTPAVAPGPEAAATKQEKSDTGENEDEHRDQVSIGLDYYAGRSNLEGERRFSDGFWIGAGPLYPSAVYLHGASRSGAEAKVSFGAGDLYLGTNSTLKQPLEAWLQQPLGDKSKVTLGKYYVPFGLQEWQYETKWGGMIQRSLGQSDVAASANYDDVAHHSNLYFRGGRNLGKNLNLGFSAALGRGLSYGSAHNRAVGADLTANWHGFLLQSEYVELRDATNGNFHFAYGKLTYDEWGKLKPYLGRYSWNDASGVFGTFGSSVLGTTFQATPSLSFEVASAKTSAKRVNWIQLHWTPEWKFIDKAPKKAVFTDKKNG